MQFESAIVQNLTLSVISAYTVESQVLPAADALLALIEEELGVG